MGHAGRPRKSGAIRNLPPSQRPKDMGTPELQDKRRAAASGGDPSLSTHAIDRAFAEGAITAAQRKAAWYYAILRQSVYGRLTPSTPGYELFYDRPLIAIDEERDIELSGKYAEAEMILRDCGVVPRQAVRELALNDCDIRCFGIRTALQALVDHWKLA